MKKILILIVLSLGYLLGYSQFPITQSIGSPKTKVVNKGIFYSDSAIIVTGYTDTTQANLGYIKNIPHVIIATSNDIWIRNIAATAWLQLVNIGSGATDTLAWRLSGNNATGMGGTPVMGTISYTDFNFATNNLKRFGISKDGIQDSTVNVVNLGIDTTTGYLSYARAGGGGGGSGTVTSVATNTGTGLRGGTITGAGTLFNDTLILATRAWRQKGVDSLLALIGAKPSGSGTTDYLARWTNSTTLGIGATRDDGTNVGIGVAPGTYKLNVNGSLNVASSIYLPSSASTTGNIYKNNTKWLHNGGLAGSSLTNIYLGNNAGNDTALFYNIGIGQDALKLNNGYGNIALGAYAMAVMAGYDGGDNSSNGIAIGAEAMKDATGGHRPIAIGTVAGQWFNGSSVSVIAIGKTTAAANYGGVGSTYVGASIASLGTKDTADWNAIVGADAFEYIGKAHGNSSVGALIASGATTASYNTAAGFHALNSLVTGDFNNAVGYYAGAGIVAGTNNVHIGRFADAYGGDYSNKLVINSTSGGGSRHLINGDFIDGKVGINRTLSEIAAGSQALQVNGNIYGTQNLKLGGIPAGIGNKVVMFDLSDSTFRLKDTTGWGGGGGTPGGANTEIQFNNSGAFGASANFTWNGSRMSTIAATIGSTSTPDATSPLTVDAASTNTAYLLQMGKNGNPAYFRVDKDGNITDIGGGAAPIGSSGGKPNFTNGFASISWASNSEGNAVLSTLSGSTVPWVLNTSSSTTDNMVSFRVMGNNATTKGDIQQWTDNSSNILSVINKDGKIGAGVSSPTAFMHLKAGTATANTAPIKLNTGTALTTPEDGAIEYHGSHIYFTIGSTRYQLDQQAGTNLGNSNLTQTGGNRTFTGAGQNLIFNGSGGTSLFNVEYNSIILTAQNSGVNIQGDSILISANVGKVYIDSLPPSIDAIDSVVVITPTGQLKQKAQSDLVGGLLSSTYTPTLTNVANVAASTAYSCQYSRVGTVVTVSGEVDIDPTTTLTLTQLGISLPIASNLTATNELGGTSADDLNTAARVAGDATNNRAEIRMTPVDVTNRRFSFTFTYRVL